MAFAPQQQVYHTGPSDNFGAMDRSADQVGIGDSPVPAMQGVFESEPQLQVDFILTYVHLTSMSSSVHLLIPTP